MIINVNRSIWRIVLFFCVIFTCEVVGEAQSKSRVCSNTQLIKAIRIIDEACNEISCDFRTLRQLDQGVDKAVLLRAFRDNDLQSVHIFFPMNEYELSKSFDWDMTKRAQLSTLKYINDPRNAIVYVLGRASTVGNVDINQRLSRQRMESVMNFLKKELKVECYEFHGGWFGKEVQQWTLSDAHFLNIEPRDFRSDELILNQSVHIFVFPCAHLLN